MRFKFLIIPAVLIFQVAVAQKGTASQTTQGPTPSLVSATTTTAVTPNDPAPVTASPVSTQTLILDYKSVYETATAEDEVKLAAERFNLTPDQQDLWLSAAMERRAGEKQAYAVIDSKDSNYGKEGAYRGLRSAQNMFYETIVGHLSPAQKQTLETDRLIREEKLRKLSFLAPTPVVPTVTIIPVDSAAIKKEAEKARKDAEKAKAKGKKSKKEKKG